MNIPSYLWMPIVLIAGGLLSWLFRLEYRLNQGLSREEHERICDRKHLELTKKFDELGEFLTRTEQERREDRAKTAEALAASSREDREYRERVSNSLHAIGLQVAVLAERDKHHE
jgi:hypothetical protein